jgi:hypothetical protein
VVVGAVVGVSSGTGVGVKVGTGVLAGCGTVVAVDEPPQAASTRTAKQDATPITMRCMNMLADSGWNEEAQTALCPPIITADR